MCENVYKLEQFPFSRGRQVLHFPGSDLLLFQEHLLAMAKQITVKFTLNLGHFHLSTWNQSIVQQLMSEGNCRSLFLKASPMGENAIIMWRFVLHRSTKYENIASGE